MMGGFNASQLCPQRMAAGTETSETWNKLDKLNKFIPPMASMYQSIQHSPLGPKFQRGSFSSQLGKKWNSQFLKELNIL